MAVEIICPLNRSRSCPSRCDFFPINRYSQTRIRALKGLPQSIVEKEIDKTLDRAASTISGLREIDGVVTEGFAQLGAQSPLKVRQPDCLKPEAQQNNS